jgi:hypothetical protein
VTAEPSLSAAAITFTPSPDGKPADAALSVFVSTRVLRTVNVLFAHRAGFAEVDTWTGATTYDLQTTPIVLSELAGDIEIRLEWEPASAGGACRFGYDLGLTFTNGAVLNHQVDDVVVDDQDRRRTSTIPLAVARNSLRSNP